MYTKHDWQDGELITKTLMNNMEAGIEDANNRAMTPGPARLILTMKVPQILQAHILPDKEIKHEY